MYCIHLYRGFINNVHVCCHVFLQSVTLVIMDTTAMRRVVIAWMDLSQCSTVSGICHTGCSDGYTGSLCKEGAFILKRFVFKRNSETKSMGRCNHVYITALLHKTYGNV